MIELDVVDDGNVGQVFEELCGLVEERTIVLVALDDEVSPLPQTITRAIFTKIASDAADEHTGIGPAVCQHPSGKRGSGRLAVRAGDHDRARAPQEILAD